MATLHPLKYGGDFLKRFLFSGDIKMKNQIQSLDLFAEDAEVSINNSLGSVKCHRNLNAPNKSVEWSIAPLQGDLKNKVLGYGQWVSLKDVFFRVQPTGVKRIREKNVRSVVAWAQGTLVSLSVTRLRYPDHNYDLPEENFLREATEWTQVSFHAFNGDPTFVITSTGKPIKNASEVLLSASGKCFVKI
ncbi:MAG: hypothetical protein ACJAS1_001624 [Oleiphilaceae bacterium]|jgi:hypothetical protein